jgi:hypothetical protein
MYMNQKIQLTLFGATDLTTKWYLCMALTQRQIDVHALETWKNNENFGGSNILTITGKKQLLNPYLCNCGRCEVFVVDVRLDFLNITVRYVVLKNKI